MLHRIWHLCCSLKLAIILTSIATVIAIGGSLVMHFNPQLFGRLDALSFSAWHTGYGSKSVAFTAWFYLTGFFLVLLGINTGCCFIDWLFRIRVRWRKTGEYLIHLGFVLIIIAYFWGSFAGTRSEGVRFNIGQIKPVLALPGHYLRLDDFATVLNERGRPMDMKSSLSLLNGDQIVKSVQVHSNTPLIYAGLTVVPASYGEETVGYDVMLTALNRADKIMAGNRIALKEQTTLTIQKFYPDAARFGNQVVRRNSNTVNPAIMVMVSQSGVNIWSGWVFLRDPLPQFLHQIGFSFVVHRPITRVYSVLTINTDPGMRLALAGSICLTIGVIVTLFSFYYKRQRGDRPDIC
jgi:cytochrome c biogenesis protein